MPASRPGPARTQPALQSHSGKPLRHANAEQGREREHQQRGEGERRDAANAARADRQAEQHGQPERVRRQLEEVDEVHRLVERRRLAVERPLRHRQDDAGRGQRDQRDEPEPKRAPERRRGQHREDRHRHAAGDAGDQERVRRRQRLAAEGELLDGKDQRRRRERGEHGDEDASTNTRFPGQRRGRRSVRRGRRDPGGRRRDDGGSGSAAPPRSIIPASTARR